MAVKISKVLDCDARDCVYNRDGICHTFAITVGDEEPDCDTYYQADHKGGVQQLVSTVGSCKVEGCKFNRDFECTADGIHVANNRGRAMCSTFKPS